MRPPRLFRSVSFRLAAFYVLLFVGSVGVLAATAYVMTTRAMEQSLRARIAAEGTLLQREYAERGMEGLARLVRERQRGTLVGGLDYGVYDATGAVLLGAVPKVALAAGWTELRNPPDGDEKPGDQEILLLRIDPLPNGNWLAVGDDLNPARDLANAMLSRFGWILALAVTFAVAGGAALSNAFLRRVDAITRTAEAIISGDLRHRIPSRGTGDDMDRLAATLNRMLDQIAALMDSVRQTGSDIAHDLRTPLGRLRQQLDEVRRTAASPADYQAAIDRAITEADALLATFTALLRIAQIEAGVARAGFAPVDLAALVDDVCRTLAPVAEDEGRVLIWSTTDTLARIPGDRQLLAQLLVNLVENAIRHTPRGTRIDVTLQPGAGGPDLAVADSGPGVPAGERDHVLERFYRLEHSRTTPGNGLGLSLVAAIAAQHHARLTLSDNHPGLRVTVGFAAAEIAVLASAPASAAALAPRPG